MFNKLIYLPFLATLALGACTTVADEQLSAITVDGKSYTLRTRTIEGPNGSFETTSARVRGGYYLCKIDSPGDCEAAVKRGLETSVINRD